MERKEQQLKKSEGATDGEDRISEQQSILDKAQKVLLAFWKDNKKIIITAAVVAMAAVIVKKQYYDRLIPSSDLIPMIEDHSFSKIYVGNLLMYGFVKEPGSGVETLRIGTTGLISDQTLAESLTNSGTPYSKLVPSEIEVAGLLGMGVSFYVLYKFSNLILYELIQLIRFIQEGYSWIQRKVEERHEI